MIIEKKKKETKWIKYRHLGRGRKLKEWETGIGKGAVLFSPLIFDTVKVEATVGYFSFFVAKLRIYTSLLNGMITFVGYLMPQPSF